jgi:hypothetical protein
VERSKQILTRIFFFVFFPQSGEHGLKSPTFGLVGPEHTAKILVVLGYAKQIVECLFGETAAPVGEKPAPVRKICGIITALSRVAAIPM